MARQHIRPLRRGWTTGACAAGTVVKDAGDDPDVTYVSILGTTGIVVP
jgi:cobalamin biosynthesis protein CbiD